MKLAFALFKYFPFGGLQRDCLGIARECIARGHEVTLYCLRAEADLPKDLTIKVLPVKGIRNHIRYRNFANRLADLRKAGEYDFLLGFNKMPGLDVYYAADSCFVEKNRSKNRFYLAGRRYRDFRDFERAVFGLDQKTEILLLDPVAEEEYSRNFSTPAKRMHLLPPGIAADRKLPCNPEALRDSLRQELKIGPDEFLLLMVGSGFRTKGLDRALRAVAALPEELRQKLHFLVIGNDKTRPYLSLARKLGISNRLTLSKGRDDIPRVLQGADLLIHPAYKENTGMVILEAVVAGLPVLVTDTCGFARHVSASGAGRVIQSPFSQRELDITLKEMLTSEERENWGQAGIRYGQQEDFFRPYKKVADLIDQFIKNFENLNNEEQRDAVLA